ncbi:hypothetical protein EPR50_G00151390 [Perca flavescens]|uniref:US22 family protein n=2 Tax=Perca flavescens TaxID=8167 RepID=A0A484CR15_PERFV|nr:uncharacterized protein LOC114568212 isoform X1 [Perca flavescens]TDH04388.1 hypothetical protein EPR50_G00151390 [Perca flavescens]
MADSSVISMPADDPQLSMLERISREERRRGADPLKWVSDFVSDYRHKTVSLINPSGAKLTIGDLEDTMYRGKNDEVNGWGKFYLPEKVTMEVIGVVEGTSCPCDELVLMICCEDAQVYAYDGEEEELHLVASSLDQVLHVGIEYPATTSYYKGEAFKDMTEEDWAEVRKGDVGKRLDEEHHQLVMSKKSELLKNLKSTQHTTEVCS